MVGKRGIVIGLLFAALCLSMTQVAHAFCNSNGACESGLGENTMSCPQDCTSVTTCGDSKCLSTETCSNCPADCGICPGSTCSSTSQCQSGLVCCGTCQTPACALGQTSTSGCGLYEQRTCNPDGCGYGACKCIPGTQLYGSNYCPKQFQFKTCQADGTWGGCQYDCTNICAIADNCNVPINVIGCYQLYACTGTTCSPGVAKPDGGTCSVPVCGGFSTASGLCHNIAGTMTCDPNYIACQLPNFCATTNVANSHPVTSSYTYYCAQNECRACNSGYRWRAAM